MNKTRFLTYIGLMIMTVIFWFGVNAIIEIIIDRAEAAYPLECREFNVSGVECIAAVTE